MTSRRSEDNPTTNDWLAQRNGEYYDSIWPVDSQGRRIPPSTQITVIPSSSILDTARAAQAANRERLDRRDNNLLIEKEAVRRIKKDREKEQKDEEGKIISRGVTEGSYYTVLPKRKFGGFGWIVQEHLGEFYVNSTNGLTVINSSTDNLFAATSLRKTLFQVYRLYTPLIYFQPFALPSVHTVYVSPPTSNENPLKCNVLSQTKNSVTLKVSGQIEAPGSPSNKVVTTTVTRYLAPHIPGWMNGYPVTTGDFFNNTTTSRFQFINGGTTAGEDFYEETVKHTVNPQSLEFRQQKYFLQVGVFFSKSSLSKSSYVYIFHKKDSAASSPQLFDSGIPLSELSSNTSYPNSSIVEPGSTAEVTIDMVEITPTSKNAMSNLLKDVYNNTVEQRTFESGRVGNFTLQSQKIETSYQSTTTDTFTSNFQPVPGSIFTTGTSLRVETTSYAPAPPKEFDETIEIIMVEKNFGPLE